MTLTNYKNQIKNPLKQASLMLLIDKDKILLAMKKRGFGKDRWNGVGGKPNPSEAIDDAAIRETKEEIDVVPVNFHRCAIINFYFPPNPDWNQQVIVYICENWDGEPKETEEMKPQWFNIKDIPYESMWPDDKYWIPQVLEGKLLNADFLFGEKDSVLEHTITEVEKLDK